MSEELIYSLRFAVIGIAIVFSALAIIAVTVYFVSRIEKYVAGMSKVPAADQTEPRGTIDNTTVVLISAAVATMIRGRYHIKRIRRLFPGDRPSSPWSVQGLAILHGSHVIRKQ
jgi:Na+-transporting methylmalonyl-CoA/oxaloacetate decarboxylase gamma subunit